VTVIYGEARVSGESQDLAAQLVDLKVAGYERIYREKISVLRGRAAGVRRAVRQAGDRDLSRRPPRLSRARSGARLSTAVRRRLECLNHAVGLCPEDKGVYADLADALVFMVSPANGFGGCAC
jgi:hypothetical protein